MVVVPLSYLGFRLAHRGTMVVVPLSYLGSRLAHRGTVVIVLSVISGV